jgi:predicted transcriptional regulator with HTH domain
MSKHQRISGTLRFTQLVTFWERFLAAKRAFNRAGGRTLEHVMRPAFFAEGLKILGTIDRLLGRMLPGNHSMTSYDIKKLTHILFPQDRKQDYDALKTEALRASIVRRAYNENNLRRRVAKLFEDEMKKQGVSARELARRMESSPTQVRRLLHKEVGGSLTLDTLCRAAVALGVVFSIDFGAPE